MAFMGKQPKSAPKCVIPGLTCVAESWQHSCPFHAVFSASDRFFTVTMFFYDNEVKTVFDVFIDTLGLGCFGCRGLVSALLCQKCIFLKTNKADQTHCENWQRESGSEFQKISTMSQRGEGR